MMARKMNVFINPRAVECGVHQFGKSLWRILAQSQKHTFHYAEPGSGGELNAVLMPPADVARLTRVLSAAGCQWLDEPDLSGEPDFLYQGHWYSFLALGFRKVT